MEMQVWEDKDLLYREIEFINNFLFRKGLNYVIDNKKRLALRYQSSLQNSLQNLKQTERSSYFNRLEKYQVFVIDRTFYDRKGNEINTKGRLTKNGTKLVMTKTGLLFMGNVSDHSVFMAGEPIAYACIIKIKNGKIKKEVPWSRHMCYKPTPDHRDQFYDFLRRTVFKDLTTFFKYYENLLPIFLTANKHDHMPKGFYQCVLSKLPACDPVELKCGHIFNKIPLEQWLDRSLYCIVCMKKAEKTDITICNEQVSKVALERYGLALQKIVGYNENIQKIIECVMDCVITDFHSVGVTIFVPKNFKVQELIATAKKIKVYTQCSQPNPTITLHTTTANTTANSDVTNSTRTLEQIINRKDGIPVFSVFI